MKILITPGFKAMTALMLRSCSAFPERSKKAGDGGGGKIADTQKSTWPRGTFLSRLLSQQEQGQLRFEESTSGREEVVGAGWGNRTNEMTREE